MGHLTLEGKMSTTLINLFGTSSVGKSSLMTDLYTTLKIKGYSVEMCPEIVKQWVWESHIPNKYEQFFLMGEEIRQQSRLFGKVEYVISDSPVWQNSFYNWYLNMNDYLSEPSEHYSRMAEKDGVIIRNYMLYRNKPYEAKGRYQTEEESDKIAEALNNYLSWKDVRYAVLAGKDAERTKQVLQSLGL